MNFRLLIGLTILLTCISCRKNNFKDLSQDKIHCDYEVFYDQNENKTHVVARFRLGGEDGNIIELPDSAGASVTFDGQKLPYNIWYGGHHKAYPGRLTTGTFVYMNTNGDVFTNEVPKGNEIGFPADFDTLEKHAQEVFYWDGEALKENEKVSLFIGSWTWGEKSEITATTQGETKLTIRLKDKEHLGLGNTMLYLDRYTEKEIAEGTPEGGKIRYKFRGTNTVVQVIE